MTDKEKADFDRDCEVAEVLEREFTTAAQSEYHRGWNDAIQWVARKLRQGAV